LKCQILKGFSNMHENADPSNPSISHHAVAD
jgi:hypothetical protein